MARPRPKLPGCSEIPMEMVQEILLKLPTRDVARCCCVSRLWRGAVRNASFRRLHAAGQALRGGAEALLVTEERVQGRAVEPLICSASSSTRMCRVAGTGLDMTYNATNACNGLVAFGSAAYPEAPPMLCNPATGEAMALPAAAPADDCEMDRYQFLLGFSSGEYKLFRLAFREHDGAGHRMDVCTLGDPRGWRRLPRRFPHRTAMYDSAPACVGGRLYVLARPLAFAGEVAAVMAVDVAAEEHRTYRLPDGIYDRDDVGNEAFVDVLDMRGRLCLAVNSILLGRPKLEFWVMPRLGRLHDTSRRLDWRLRYTFRIGFDHELTNAKSSFHAYRGYKDQLRAAWLDGDDMLCYIHGDHLYKYNTRRGGRSPPDASLQWDQKIQLSTPPSLRCNIYGGYRPSLLSPHDFALPASQDGDEDGQIENASELRRHKSDRRPSAHHRPAKRVCRRTCPSYS